MLTVPLALAQFPGYFTDLNGDPLAGGCPPVLIRREPRRRAMCLPTTRASACAGEPGRPWMTLASRPSS